ncbi:Dll4 [Symbiodinium sp. CCMP2456]|nr:Dll4 [Symbiodinium sp. CCMP2456]
MVQLCRQHLLVGLPVVLGVCLHLSLAARAASWEDEPQQGRPKSDSDRETWGDFFGDLNDLLRTLDLVWFLVAATIALALACWQPSQIVGDTSQVGSDGVKWTPPPWYTLTTIFASLSSHAAGILGFVGFQKIVVARIVSTSQPRANWSAPNFLLLTSILISITAIFSSLVFMGVDYLRRLAIDSARSRGYRLVVTHGKLERTGLGMALIMLTFVLIALYMLVIYTERQNSKKQEESPDSAVNDSRDMKVFLDKACSCATVLLYFFNLRSLCESPKVQFHQTVASAGEPLEQISIKDYLTKFCIRRDERSNVRSCLACLAHCLAGEDIGILVKMGTRRALFPNQRFAPLLNIVGIVMLFGLLPGIFQIATERLFVDPQILEVRAISADLLPAFDAESGRGKYVLLLGKEPRLHVKTRAAQTSSIEICCETGPDTSKNCTAHPLQHSLIQFDEKPAILKIPVVASTRCSLTARGLSKKSSTTLDLMVEVKTIKHVCGCHKNRCSCCDGYEGELDAGAEDAHTMLAKDFCTPVPCAVKNSNREPGPLCNCSNGYVGDIVWEGANVSGTCTPAPCSIEDSNRKPGLQCQCKNGFEGEIQWDQSIASGECLLAHCGIPNSIGKGPDCKCMDGYDGNITWNRSHPHGACEPAAGCGESIANSEGKGNQCKCKRGFTGNIRWHGSVPQGSCQAAVCRIQNSNQQPGLDCKCRDGYLGDIVWQGDRVSGTCTPAPCVIKNSNRLPGQECACLDGFAGEITWKGRNPRGRCERASCANVANTTGSGPTCRCSNGYDGTVTWLGANASGSCKPAACTIPNSNMQDGPACKCLEGFEGSITWWEKNAYGSCQPLACTGSHSTGKEGSSCGCTDGFFMNGSKEVLIGQSHQPTYGYARPRKAVEVKCLPAACTIEHSNGKPGQDCACLDAYLGHISWEGPVPSGHCRPSPCGPHRVPNSNGKPGLECKCSDGFSGQITWRSGYESGSCVPASCNIPNSNRKPGQACECEDGFIGEIVWREDVPSGSCKPAPCNIRNSNLKPGPDCRCKDGFQGDITWHGPLAAGACEPVPCRVLHSDHAPGPACRCLHGFFGSIVWSGVATSGGCEPRPLCGSEEEAALHVTRLTAGLVDGNNNTCTAGQAMLVHGHAVPVHSSFTKFVLRWTSAHALPPAKCKVDWPEARHAVPFNNPDPKHFSLTSWCATTPGLPLCSSQIIYTVTTRGASHYACDACKTSEHVLTEFRGSRCGYDLIKWESLTISPGSPDACTCNLSLSCSKVPSEELPRACIHFAEPAVLSYSKRDEDDEEKDSDAFLIFYETGEQLFSSADFEMADAFAAASADHTWLSDGKNLHITNPERSDVWLGRAGGSRFFHHDGALRARGVLPEWWNVKFKQDAALPGSFNADTLLGCEISIQSDNFCYSTRFGESVQVAPTQEEDCAFEDVTVAGNRIAYEYKSSAFGVQTYRSSVTCYPTAAFEEILVQVVDVGMPAGHVEAELGDSRCRRTIHYRLDAWSYLSECHAR